MTYLFLLCLTLFLLTFFYFFAFNQDLIAPPVVMSVMFLISSVFALINVQNWNIEYSGLVKGDMSLVGTRPPTVDEYEHYTPEQKRRLSFKPGITGLWQVSGRSEIKNFDEVVKLDVAYIDGWTIWKDIEILLKTVKVVLMKDGAK